MNKIDENKPCVVNTPQGFSVLYKKRYLYSKYDPQKLINQKINSLQILEGTIILCCSPVLCYGIELLQTKLPTNCLLVFCEFDEELFTFSNEFIKKQNNDFLLNVYFPKPNELYDLPLFLFNKMQNHSFKRISKIDFSSGTQFFNELYQNLEDKCRNAISTFWKNRITLIKFGRKYSKNFFSNLKVLHKTIPIENFINKITKPIIVFGAGESTQKFIFENQIPLDNFYILCVDTIYSFLKKNNVCVDGIFIEEAQNIILQSFFNIDKKVHIFAGLSSINSLKKMVQLKQISFFTTKYSNSNFIENLKKNEILPFINQPFGSVGLTAVFYALKFRQNNSLPIYTTGFDFSYSLGNTHSKNTLASNLKLRQTNRLISIENFCASFNESSKKIKGKQNKIFFSTPILLNYAQNFIELFSNEKNLFDLYIQKMSGIDLKLQIKKIEQNDYFQNDFSINLQNYSSDLKQKLDSFFYKEKKSLQNLQKLLTQKTQISTQELQEQITNIVENREYLFLHFPDGIKFIYNQSFLNRLKNEVLFFLKIFE